MSDTLISTQDTEECIVFLLLRSQKEYDIDEDNCDVAVAERNMEDEEATRALNALSSPCGDNDGTPLNDVFVDRNTEDEEHATDEEADETKPKEFEEPVESIMPLNEEECMEECMKSCN